MVGDSLKSDIQASKNATNGEIGGILISSNPDEKTKEYCKHNKCLIIHHLSGVSETVEKYFSS